MIAWRVPAAVFQRMLQRCAPRFESNLLDDDSDALADADAHGAQRVTTVALFELVDRVEDAGLLDNPVLREKRPSNTNLARKLARQVTRKVKAPLTLRLVNSRFCHGLLQVKREVELAN